MANQPPRLPATFASLYRLFLRMCSASVLHHHQATRNLRTLYRPMFDAGAQVTKQLQLDSGDAAVRARRVEWLDEWNKRVDNTLSLLHNSCTSRGLSHRLTRNLGYFVHSERQRLWAAEYKFKTWNPSQPPTSPAYKLPQLPTKGQIEKEQKKQQGQAFEMTAWNAMSEVVRMAEGRDGISLGQIALKRRIRRT